MPRIGGVVEEAAVVYVCLECGATSPDEYGLQTKDDRWTKRCQDYCVRARVDRLVRDSLGKVLRIRAGWGAPEPFPEEIHARTTDG